jgi:hydrogenase maturation protein HypF
MSSRIEFTMRRIQAKIRGAVQGVGFRPFVYSLASRLGLGGYVLNEPAGVELELEGNSAAIDEFLLQLHDSPPPLARILEVAIQEAEPQGQRDFIIRESSGEGQRTVLVAPDMSTCEDCLCEMNDSADRRHSYPFINCTNCGPRYTIIRDLPYDRQYTTMSAFEMCPDCRAEYEDPSNRRFHAEPTCCPVCGPRIWLEDTNGSLLECDDAVAEALRLIGEGHILAMKGLGGFHLVCDATNDDAVNMLRQRKERDRKPFAVMVRDIKVVSGICQLTPEAEETLHSPQRPILLMAKQDDSGLAEGIAPGSSYFGLMLPYTPLHYLIMQGPFDALVMTSGNISDEPIAHENDDARRRLAELADYFLLHDRDIHIRTDDSVVQLIDAKLVMLRRSRGYIPFPIELPQGIGNHNVLAVGPELNNTVCLTRGDMAYISHHVGDLQNVPAYDAFVQAVGHMQDILSIKPQAVACDMHPGYLSTRYAKECGLPLIEVQHHHAHIASVLVEAGCTEPVIGVAYDGMGWGDDGLSWGGEFMVCDLAGYERMGYLEPTPQPGGDAAAKKIVRMAFSFLMKEYGEEATALASELLPSLNEQETKIIAQQIERGLNCPLTSSMGRLFDAVSALTGICDYNSYHARAPMEMQARAMRARDEEGCYAVRIDESQNGQLIVRTGDIIRAVIEDRRKGICVDNIAARFHNTIVRLTLDICKSIRYKTKLSKVALSGGVIANALLTERLLIMLRHEGFETMINRQAPPSDGGVSLGQAAIAAWRLQCV